MAHQIVKQPNGKFAVWSTVVDDFVMVDVTAEDIINDWINDERRKLTERVEEVIGKLNRGEKPYFQFTRSFDECLQTIRDLHGDNAASLKHFSQSGESGTAT